MCWPGIRPSPVSEAGEALRGSLTPAKGPRLCSENVCEGGGWGVPLSRKAAWRRWLWVGLRGDKSRQGSGSGHGGGLGWALWVLLTFPQLPLQTPKNSKSWEWPGSQPPTPWGVSPHPQPWWSEMPSSDQDPSSPLPQPFGARSALPVVLSGPGRSLED